MTDSIMTTGIYHYRNNDGTTVPINVGELPVTSQPANIIIPNVWVAGEEDAEPTGMLHVIMTPLLWADPETKRLHRTTTPPKVDNA
jgi:hypothetical protein